MLISFDRLEKEKTALLLYINISHTESLYTIDKSVAELVATIPYVDWMDHQLVETPRRHSLPEDQWPLTVSQTIFALRGSLAPKNSQAQPEIRQPHNALIERGTAPLVRYRNQSGMFMLEHLNQREGT
jgi:hypothetical protein